MVKSYGEPALKLARTLSPAFGPTTSQTHPDPGIAIAVRKIMFRRAARDPKSRFILSSRSFGIGMSGEAPDWGCFRLVGGDLKGSGGYYSHHKEGVVPC